MLKFTFCPTFTIVSFIFFITLLEILVYITTLIATGAKGYDLDSKSFLGPNVIPILDDFGMRNSAKIKCRYQIWRFVTPIFLHAGFMHIFVSISKAFNLW